MRALQLHVYGWFATCGIAYHLDVLNLPLAITLFFTWPFELGTAFGLLLPVAP